MGVGSSVLPGTILLYKRSSSRSKQFSQYQTAVRVLDVRFTEQCAVFCLSCRHGNGIVHIAFFAGGELAGALQWIHASSNGVSALHPGSSQTNEGRCSCSRTVPGWYELEGHQRRLGAEISYFLHENETTQHLHCLEPIPRRGEHAQFRQFRRSRFFPRSAVTYPTIFRLCLGRHGGAPTVIKRYSNSSIYVSSIRL